MAAATTAEADLTTSDLIEVRRSDVHGLGVFAAKPIPKGTRIIEYVGERVSHDEADRRYEEKDITDSHTFLFIVDNKTVIDAGVDGNDARFFNHSCDPNCESTVEKKRVFIEAVNDIQAGDELTYDYQIYKEEGDPDNIEEIFACRCGAANCRGTMLWPIEPKKPRKKPAKRAEDTSRAKGKSTGKSRSSGKGKSPAKGGKTSARSSGKGRSSGRSNSSGKSGSSKSRAKVGGKAKGKGTSPASSGRARGKAGARSRGKGKSKRGGRRG